MMDTTSSASASSPPAGDSARNDPARPPIMSSLGLDIPLSSVSPSPPPTGKSRKYSPLTDLVESEKAYVELLSGIIRKVAAAWSRSNLPPFELDVMFRSVEGVYKTNRTLLAKLKAIGENPSSPKALGDLLMRWIDELEQPYMTYADRYCVGFDDWRPVRSNAKLPPVLQAFSVSHPPPLGLPDPTHPLNLSLWTLDALFLVPKGRLQYYRKLYCRLLKSTTPGRSDHKLLSGALERLDRILATLEGRANNYVGFIESPRILPRSEINTVANSVSVTPTEPQVYGPIEEKFPASLPHGSEHLSRGISFVSANPESPQAISSPVLDIERRLATDNTLDIFTMRPKQIRLQIAPPTLSYVRELRLSARVLVQFTPKATGIEVIHRQGRVYILSDLFLLCEEMAREERAARGEDGRDMRLCYPPLSGKVLEVAAVVGQDNALQVSIMRKETLLLEAISQHVRDQILNEFQECISYAKMISETAQEQVLPTPPISDRPQSPTTLPRTRERPDRALNPLSLTTSQPPNAPYVNTTLTNRTPVLRSSGLPGALPSQHGFEQRHVPSQLDTIQDTGRDAFINSPSPTSPSHGQGVQLLFNQPVYPPRRSSTSYGSPPSSFVPGQVVPPVPVRSASIQSQSSFGEYTPGLPERSGPPIAQNPAQQSLTSRHHASSASLHQQPLRHQPSLHSLPRNPNTHAINPTTDPQSGLHSSNTQPLLTHPPNFIGTPRPVEEKTSHKLQKSSSSRSLHSQYQYNHTVLPPVPSLPDGLPMPQRPYKQRKDSIGSLNAPMSRPLLPSVQMGSRTNSVAEPSILDPSPPTSPAEERKPLGPVRSVIMDQMKCKVFHQQQHAQWKSLGSANLTLYHQEPTNVKQLVVEAGNKEKSLLISTIVLTDGVERVGKTGVAIELSDAGGARTGVIYMIQLRNEDSASGLFKMLLAGSDRAT